MADSIHLEADAKRAKYQSGFIKAPIALKQSTTLMRHISGEVDVKKCQDISDAAQAVIDYQADGTLIMASILLVQCLLPNPRAATFVTDLKAIKDYIFNTKKLGLKHSALRPYVRTLLDAVYLNEGESPSKKRKEYEPMDGSAASAVDTPIKLEELESDKPKKNAKLKAVAMF